MKDELLLSLNEFNENTKLNGVDALLRLFFNLLVIKKGTYPDNPTMGIDLKQYLFMTVDKASYKLITEINSQVVEFLPDMNLFEVKLLQSKNNPYVIGIYVTFGYNGNDFDLLLKSNNEKELSFKLSKFVK